MDKEQYTFSILAEYGGFFLVISIASAFTEFIICKFIDFISVVLGFTISILIILYLLRKHHETFLFGKEDLAEDFKTGIFISILYIIYIVFVFSAYPIFPYSQSGDFRAYIDIALRFMWGTAKYNILLGMHPVIYLLLASALSFFKVFSDNPILISRIFMMLLIFYSFILLYKLSAQLYGRYGGETTLILTFAVNFFWVTVIIETGLYANLLGIVLTLYLFLEVSKYINTSSKKLLIYIFIVSGFSLASHETSFFFTISLWIAGLYETIIKRDLKILYTAIISTLPIAIMLLFPLSDLKAIMSFIKDYVFKLRPYTGGALTIESIDPVSTFLGKYSLYLKEIYIQSGYTALFLTLTALLLGLYTMYKKMDGIKLIPWFWFIIIWIFTLFFHDIWRIALYSLYPITIFLGSLNMIYPYLSKFLHRHISWRENIIKFEAIILIILLLFTFSSHIGILHGVIMHYKESRDEQRDVYNAMLWIKENTPKDSYVVSVARWEFTYTSFLINRRFLGNSYSYPNELLASLNNLFLTHDIYVAIWNKVMNKNNTILLINYYKSDSHFEKVYSNNEITVFKIKKGE